MPFYYTLLFLSELHSELVKNLAALYRRLKNNPEIARTSRDTEKTPLINWVIGHNKKNKNLREETRITRICWN